MNNELQISSAIQLVLDLSIEMNLSIPQPLFHMSFKKFKWTVAKKIKLE